MLLTSAAFEENCAGPSCWVKSGVAALLNWLIRREHLAVSQLDWRPCCIVHEKLIWNLFLTKAWNITLSFFALPFKRKSTWLCTHSKSDVVHVEQKSDGGGTQKGVLDVKFENTLLSRFWVLCFIYIVDYLCPSNSFICLYNALSLSKVTHAGKIFRLPEADF